MDVRISRGPDLQLRQYAADGRRLGSRVGGGVPNGNGYGFADGDWLGTDRAAVWDHSAAAAGLPAGTDLNFSECCVLPDHGSRAARSAGAWRPGEEHAASK